ncbi:hypothetical protein VTJ04DRAFT_4361 [Mycothermus thermophilus]|uniref:uncharacterized protein n=1 Tax=Humicola insolens TaxID=85995 RepID=UPI00374382E0
MELLEPSLDIKATTSRRKATSKPKSKKIDSRKTWKSRSKRVASSVPILRLPAEIVLLIDELLDLPSRLALSRTNRRFYSLINPVIYRDNVRLAGASSLFWGADNGLLGTVKHAVAAGADINATGPLPTKATPETPETNNTTLLLNPNDHHLHHHIIGHNDVVDINPDIELPADIETQPEPRLQQPSCTPLHLAARNGHLEIVEWLLDNGADIDAPSYRVCACPSMKASRHPSRRTSDWPRWRALHIAMCHQERAVAELLIHRGASLSLDANPGHNHTALHSAAANALVPVIKLLAINDINLDVNQRDAWDNTALHYVSGIWLTRDSLEIRNTIAKLLALGADLEAHNDDGHTPLLNACARGNYAVAQRLVEVGANPDPHRHIPGFRDCRPLYYCLLHRAEFFDVDNAPVKHDEFEGNRITLIKALVDAGADVNARFDKRGHRSCTPLMLACELDEPRAVAALIECGAEIHAQDRSGRTPLCYAVSVRVDHRSEVPEIAAIMLRHGARMDIEQDPACSPLDTAIKHIRWAEDEVLEAMLNVADSTNLTHRKLKEALRHCASTGNHKALRLLLRFADRVYRVTNADLKDYICRIIEQSDPWNQVDTFNVVMEFGRQVFTNEVLLLKTILQQNRELSLAVLDRGVNVSGPRFHGGQTYLHLACQWGDTEVVKALLERGADVDVFDRELRTPLSIAVQENFVSIAIALMKEVADPYLVPPDDLLREIALESGAEEEDVEVEVRVMKRRFLTAFDIAIRDDRVEILEDMLSRFALPEIPPGTRFSYVHRAAQNPNPTILKLLLDKGADATGGPNCPNPPAEVLIKKVWEQPRVTETAVALLKTAKLLLDSYYDESPPWHLLKEIAVSDRGEDADPERAKLRRLVLKELGVTCKFPKPGEPAIPGIRDTDEPSLSIRGRHSPEFLERVGLRVPTDDDDSEVDFY